LGGSGVGVGLLQAPASKNYYQLPKKPATKYIFHKFPLQQQK
jgi:hypothetical protein